MTLEDQITRGRIRAGACRYEFEVKKGDGEHTRVVINCFSSNGNCSRISVDEEDWPDFMAGFEEAAKAMSGHVARIAVR